MTTATAYSTREAYLTDAVVEIAALFANIGEALPAVRVSVGFAGGRGKKNTVIGQCWKASAAADGVAQVFVSPVLDDAVQVLAVLVHELVHAVDDCQSGHKGRFAQMAKALGLEGKMTATTAGAALTASLEAIVANLGTYPHAALTPGADGVEGPKTQTTRMLKVECRECGYTARTTAKWLESIGAPLCACSGLPMAQAA